MGSDPSDRAIIASRNPDIAENVAASVPGTGTSLKGMEGGVQRSEALMTQAEKSSGASSLENLQEGLRVTHDGPPSHNVVAGHSDGTTVVGTAATESAPLPVDDVILVASPGANADGVGDVNLGGVPGEAHRSYWDPADSSLTNMGLIISGNGGRVS